MLKALLDVRASLLDPKKLPASALGQFFEGQSGLIRFHLNPDPDLVRIQGLMTKNLEQKYSWNFKKNLLYDHKLQLTYP